MARKGSLLSAVDEMGDPHISTEIHQMCASVVQVGHVFLANPSEQTLQKLREFNERQLR